MGPIGIIHLVSAVISLTVGPVIFFLTKGTRLHILLGRTYVVAMLTLNVTALFIYRLFGRFGAFHILALISLLVLVAGFAAVYWKRPPETWIYNHYRAMGWSYVGLLAAGVAEAVVRIPLLREITGGWLHFGILVFGASLIVCVIGGVFIARFEQPTVSKFAPVERDAAETG